MPANTVTEYRDRNPRGRNKRKKGNKRIIDLFRGKIGNEANFHGCTHCYPKLSKRIENNAQFKKVCQEYEKQNINH